MRRGSMSLSSEELLVLEDMAGSSSEADPDHDLERLVASTDIGERKDNSLDNKLPAEKFICAEAQAKTGFMANIPLIDAGEACKYTMSPLNLNAGFIPSERLESPAHPKDSAYTPHSFPIPSLKLPPKLHRNPSSSSSPCFSPCNRRRRPFTLSKSSSLRQYNRSSTRSTIAKSLCHSFTCSGISAPHEKLSADMNSSRSMIRLVLQDEDCSSPTSTLLGPDADSSSGASSHRFLACADTFSAHTIAVADMDCASRMCRFKEEHEKAAAAVTSSPPPYPLALSSSSPAVVPKSASPSLYSPTMPHIFILPLSTESSAHTPLSKPSCSPSLLSLSSCKSLMESSSASRITTSSFLTPLSPLSSSLSSSEYSAASLPYTTFVSPQSPLSLSSPYNNTSSLNYPHLAPSKDPRTGLYAGACDKLRKFLQSIPRYWSCWNLSRGRGESTKQRDDCTEKRMPLKPAKFSSAAGDHLKEKIRTSSSNSRIKERSCHVRKQELGSIRLQFCVLCRLVLQTCDAKMRSRPRQHVFG